jgi:hypothetical protein
LSTNGQPDKPSQQIVVSAVAARGGFISGRVLLVLIVSLTLALVVMVVVLTYFYRGQPPSG